MFDSTAIRERTARIAAALPALEWITDNRVERLSLDFFWFSPVLKRQMEGLRADAVVRPKTEDEVRAVVAACATHGVPITLRGSGTGNYGQCIPLHGGVVMDLSAYNQLLWMKPGVARAQAGIRLGEMDRRTQAEGWELRCVPSTFRSATLGGLWGGGFGGVGSVNYGPLAATGNVLGVKVMTIEPEPRTLELRTPEALQLHHVYGTNGLVLELEVGLAPAHPWMESIVCFEGEGGYDRALDFANSVAGAPGVVKKGGQVTLRRTAEEIRRTNRTIVEYTWNHTTLHVLKIDKGLTYIQTGFDPTRHLQQARALRQALGDEVLVHLEFIRTKEGVLNASGLQLVRYTTDERLDEIMQIHRDHGVYIANPHVFIVEDGKQGQINREIVAAKLRYDPQGLLNPGKLRGWEHRHEIQAEQAHRGLPSTLPRF